MPWQIETRLVHKGSLDGSIGKIRLADKTELIITEHCVSPPSTYPILHPDFMPERVQAARQGELERLRSVAIHPEEIRLSSVVAWLRPESLAIGNYVTVVIQYGRHQPQEEIVFDSPVIELVETAE